MRPAKPRWALLRIDPPGADLVFQSFEEDDVGVDGDTDRHDDAGDARTATAPDLESCDRNEMIVQIKRARHAQAGGHDEPEQPVVERHEQQHEADADDAGDRSAACNESLPSVGDTVLHGLRSRSFTGSEPLFSTRARLRASDSLKLPVICTLPVNDRLLHGRRRDDLAVEHDRQLPRRARRPCAL